MVELKLEDIFRIRKKEFSNGVINNKSLWNKFKVWERKNHKDVVLDFNEKPKNIYLKREDILNPNIVMRCINYDYFENRRY